MNKEVALEKLKSYCAYQERCQQEVKQKLIKLKVFGETQDQVIITLIQENFLNEERFAQAYVSGKFNIKGWGKTKIKRELFKKGVSSYCINKGMLEIEEEEYLNRINSWIDKLKEKYKSDSDFERKGKTAKYLQNKGFEIDKVWSCLKEE